MDVLVGGGDGPPSPRLAAVLAWRPPDRVVGALAAAVLLAGVGGVAAVGAVRAAVEREADRLDLAVEARSAVAVRPRGRDGVLLLQVRNDGTRAVVLTGADVAVAGVRARSGVQPQTAAARATVQLEVPFAVHECRALADEGVVRLHARPEGRPERRVDRPVGAAEAVPADLLAAGCRPVSAPDAVALSVRAAGGDVEATPGGARGVLLVEVRNAGTRLDLVRVHAEVPGVLFSPAAVGRLPAEGRVVSRLPFDLPSCEELRRTGRVVLTVLQDGAAPVELGFRATEDEEARTVRDLDLDLVLGACPRHSPAG
jgi:hypothetical protein